VGCADLLKLAVLQDGDARPKRHGFDLIVRDIDDRRTCSLVQALDFNTHINAQLRVEIGKRLVEQEDAGLANQCAPHCDALALPS
jgi:hypothetical protein